MQAMLPRRTKTSTSASSDLVKDDNKRSDSHVVHDVSEPVDVKEARKTKYSDIFTILAAGSALISDGYQNNVANLLNTLFAKRYGSQVYTSSVSTRISNSLTVGCILGQVGVGLICDRIGRKSAIVLSTVLLATGAIFATAASPVHGNVSNLFWWLTIARGATGVGVGGEYPSSSTSASEAANERYGRQKRSTIFILCTNLVLAFGAPLAACFFLIVLSATGYDNTASASDARNLDIVWRLCFGFGALLPLIVFYFRWRIVNSKLFRAGAIRHNVPYWLALKRYWPRLLGTCFAWFLYDFVAFANGAFSSTVIATVIHNPTLKRTGEYQLLLGAIAMPGAVLGAFLVRWLGSKYQLVFGFVGYIIIGLIVGLAWDKMIEIPALFVIFYGLLASVGNAGPGSVLGLVSSESFPTSLRGTAYGISAAIGKVGAVVGTEVFKPVQDNIGKKYVFIIAAGVGVVGSITALVLVPDTTKFNLAEEDEKWRMYLLEHGWDGDMGDGSTIPHKASDSDTVVSDER